jgi:predicted nuclease of predicted toxin-antitoxin system
VRFKLDENLDPQLAPLLAEGGHEADSVREEGLGGTTDEALYGTCRSEQRVLITLDLDFSDPLRFPPEGTGGIMVLGPRRNTLALIRETLVAALPALKRERLEGALWIVEPGRIRAHTPGREG